MKPKEFHITIYSVSRFIIAFIVIMCTLFFLTDYLPWRNGVMSVIIFLVVLPLSFYLANIIGKGKAKVVFTQDAFLHIWERKFIFSFEKNIRITWDIVNNYVFEEDRNFDSFIINLTTNRRYKINRINFLPIKDDFDALVKDFPNLANQYRNQNVSKNKIEKITKGKSFYATKEFRWIFYGMTVVFIFIVISSIISSNSKANWGSLGVIACALAFYGVMIKANKRKKMKMTKQKY